MNNINEKLSAVLTEMRGNEFDDPHLSAEGMLGVRRLARDWADRIEAAVKREREAIEAASLSIGGVIEAECHRPGNTASLRKAMVGIKNVAAAGNEHCATKAGALDTIYDLATAALATPRNCDVGTAEEQQNRFREFCRRYESKGECGIGRSKAACPAFHGCRNPDCSLWWAQMAYTEGEKDGSK